MRSEAGKARIFVCLVCHVTQELTFVSLTKLSNTNKKQECDSTKNICGGFRNSNVVCENE